LATVTPENAAFMLEKVWPAREEKEHPGVENPDIAFKEKEESWFAKNIFAMFSKQFHIGLYRGFFEDDWFWVKGEDTVSRSRVKLGEEGRYGRPSRSEIAERMQFLQ